MESFANIKELSAYFGNPWFQSLGIVILSLVLTLALRWTLRFILLPLVRKTETEVDDITIRAVKRIVTYLIPLIGLMVALMPLSLQTNDSSACSFYFACRTVDAQRNWVR